MNQHERNALDRYITGNYGEDSTPREDFTEDGISCPNCECTDTELCREAFSPETPHKETPEYLHCYGCGVDSPVPSGGQS